MNWPLVSKPSKRRYGFVAEPKMETRRCSLCRHLVQRTVRSSRLVEGLSRTNTPSTTSRASFCAHPSSWRMKHPSSWRMKLLIDMRACMKGVRCFGVRDARNPPKPGENAGAHSHIRENNSAKKRGIEKYQKALHGRTKLKDARTLRHLQEMLEPFENGKHPPGVRPFRGVEAAMALNHLHRLRSDPLKTAEQHDVSMRQMASFAKLVERDVGMLSAKNIAWALNAIKGLEGYDSLFDSSAARLRDVPPAQWSIQSAALLVNAYAHGSDGLGKQGDGAISVPGGIVPHLSRVVQHLLLASALDQLNLRGGGGVAPPGGATRQALTSDLRHLSTIANAFSKLDPDDDDLFSSVSQAARRVARRYCEEGAPVYVELQDVARIMNAYAHARRLDPERLPQSRQLFDDFFTVLRVSLSQLRTSSRSPPWPADDCGPRDGEGGAPIKTGCTGLEGEVNEVACGPGCSYVASRGAGATRQVHGCIPASLGIAANSMARGYQNRLVVSCCLIVLVLVLALPASLSHNTAATDTRDAGKSRRAASTAETARLDLPASLVSVAASTFLYEEEVNTGADPEVHVQVGQLHMPTVLALLDAVQRLAHSHPHHFDIQAAVNIADAIAKLEERARNGATRDEQEAAARLRSAAPRVFSALAAVIRTLVRSPEAGKSLSILSVTTMLQSSSKLGIYHEELFNLMIQGGLESLATDSSEVKTYQAQALIRALDKVGVDDPLPR